MMHEITDVLIFTILTLGLLIPFLVGVHPMFARMAGFEYDVYMKIRKLLCRK